MRTLCLIVLVACRIAPSDVGAAGSPGTAGSKPPSSQAGFTRRGVADAGCVGSAAARRVGVVRVTGAPRDAVPQLTVLEGTLDDPPRTARVAALAAEALEARGYAHAAVRVARRGGCVVDLDVAVTLGPAFRITAIAFETDDEFPAGERLAAVEDALGTVNAVGGVYIAYRMTRALAELEQRYHDAGWIDAAVGAPRAAFDPAGSVAIAIPIAAGRRFRIGSVTALGAGPRTRQAVLHALGLRAGDYYDGPRVRTAIERARHQLARWVELHTSIPGNRPEIEVEAVVEAAP